MSCLHGLARMCSYAPAHAPLLRLDAVSLLVRYGPRCDLRSEAVAVRAACTSDAGRCMTPRAWQALCDLSAHRPSHDHFVSLGVVSLLMAQARMPDLTLRRRCAQAMYNLTCVAGNEVRARGRVRVLL